MSERIFLAMSSQRLSEEIRQAQQRVLLAAPGIHEEVAKTLCEAVDRLGQEKVDVVVDCTEEMCRLGYGDIKAIKMLDQRGIEVRHSPGLRVGVLICDNRAWSFSPTALCVEEEAYRDEHPNAVRLSPEQANQLANAICPPATPGGAAKVPGERTDEDRQNLRVFQKGQQIETNSGVIGQITKIRGWGDKMVITVQTPEESITFRPSDIKRALEIIGQEALPKAEPEIGHRSVNEVEIKRVEKALEVAPPLKFDVARQVRVFQPYIQYVTLNLKGCSISRRQVQIPKYLLNLTNDEELQSRLRTTLNLIEKTSTVSDSALRQELRLILDEYTSSLGEPYGRILLRGKRPEFDAKVKDLEQKVETHRKTIKEKLQKEINESIDRIVEAWAVHVITSPPTQLRKQVVGDPTDEKAVQWLCDELHKVFPIAEDLISEMRLNVHFRDVTYETLQNKDFEKALKKAFPYVDWDKPFKEFDAAKSKEAAPKEGAK